MRIGIYKDTLANRRGADMAVLALAEGLRERGHDAVVFEKPDFEKRIAEPWDVIISTGINEILDLYDYFSACSTRLKTPIIQQFHTNPKSQFKWKRFLRNWRIKRALHHVSAIQVLNNRFVSQVVRYGAEIEVIGNWSRYEEAYDKKTETKTIICPAAFSKGKNQILLIKAFARTAKIFPDWKLKLLGRAEGSYAEKCRKLVSKLGMDSQIEFAGWAENMADEYAQCAFVAFPSIDEGFSLTILDAAVFNKCALLTKDWIGTCHADGGLLARPTAVEYAKGLRRLMGDVAYCKKMGENAHAFCKIMYSKNIILAKWLRLLAKEKIYIVSAVRDFGFYDKLIRHNANLAECELAPVNNAEQNKSIPVIYNSFLTSHHNEDAWFVFCHEDFQFLEPLGEKLKGVDTSFIYGVWGSTLRQAGVGIQIDSNKDGSNASFRGYPVKKATVVDTVDCCCIIVHSSLIEKYSLRFDENLSFDLYAEDFSIVAAEKHGVLTKVLPIRTHHYSYGTIGERFLCQLDYLNVKHKHAGRTYVTTTCFAIGNQEKLSRTTDIIHSKNRIPFRRFFYKKISHKGRLVLKILGIPVWSHKKFDMEEWHR